MSYRATIEEVNIDKFDTFVAVSQGYWGRGKTIDEARAAMRKSGAKLSAPTILYRSDDPTIQISERGGGWAIDDGFQVFEIGRLNWEKK